MARCNCPAISCDVELQGNIYYKHKTTFKTQYLMQWGVLRRESCRGLMRIDLFSNASDHAQNLPPHLTIPLTGVLKVMSRDAKAHKNAFQVLAMSDKYHFATKSKKETESWMMQLNKMLFEPPEPGITYEFQVDILVNMDAERLKLVGSYLMKVSDADIILYGANGTLRTRFSCNFTGILKTRYSTYTNNCDCILILYTNSASRTGEGTFVFQCCSAARLSSVIDHRVKEMQTRLREMSSSLVKFEPPSTESTEPVHIPHLHTLTLPRGSSLPDRLKKQRLSKGRKSNRKSRSHFYRNVNPPRETSTEREDGTGEESGRLGESEHRSQRLVSYSRELSSADLEHPREWLGGSTAEGGWTEEGGRGQNTMNGWKKEHVQPVPVVAGEYPGSSQEKSVAEEYPGPSQEMGVAEGSPGFSQEMGVAEGSPGPSQEMGVAEGSPGPSQERGVAEGSPGPSQEKGVAEEYPGPSQERGVAEKSFPGPSQEMGVAEGGQVEEEELEGPRSQALPEAEDLSGDDDIYFDKYSYLRVTRSFVFPNKGDSGVSSNENSGSDYEETMYLPILPPDCQQSDGRSLPGGETEETISPYHVASLTPSFLHSHLSSPLFTRGWDNSSSSSSDENHEVGPNPKRDASTLPVPVTKRPLPALPHPDLHHRTHRSRSSMEVEPSNIKLAQSLAKNAVLQHSYSATPPQRAIQGLSTRNFPPSSDESSSPETEGNASDLSIAMPKEIPRAILAAAYEWGRGSPLFHSEARDDSLDAAFCGANAQATTRATSHKGTTDTFTCRSGVAKPSRTDGSSHSKGPLHKDPSVDLEGYSTVRNRLPWLPTTCDQQLEEPPNDHSTILNQVWSSPKRSSVDSQGYALYDPQLLIKRTSVDSQGYAIVLRRLSRKQSSVDSQMYESLLCLKRLSIDSQGYSRAIQQTALFPCDIGTINSRGCSRALHRSSSLPCDITTICQVLSSKRPSVELQSISRTLHRSASFPCDNTTVVLTRRTSVDSQGCGAQLQSLSNRPPAPLPENVPETPVTLPVDEGGSFEWHGSHLQTMDTRSKARSMVDLRGPHLCTSETDFSWETVYDYVAVGRLRRLKSSVCSSATPAMPSSYH